jgi:peptide deformylase
MFYMTVDPNSLILSIHPDPILRRIGEEVDPKDENVQAVAKRMIEIMFEHSGIGLAAPQVGLPWRVFVTRNPEDEECAVVWINPELEVLSEEIESEEEGCLSLPEIRGDIRRPNAIRITGHDIQGNKVSAESGDFIARVWQHENDHLDGILIIDKMSTMDKLVNRKLIRNLERVR